MRDAASKHNGNGNGNGNGRARPAASPVKTHSPQHASSGAVLITGGAGFIGTNLAHRLASEGVRVVLFDNLSRPGVEHNARWLLQNHGDRIHVEVADVTDYRRLAAAAQDAAAVFHFAAQVAVTTSLTDPRHDFLVNLLGTINLLEALRQRPSPPPLVFTSTNKVYGSGNDLALERRGSRYLPTDAALLNSGINEDRPLAFHTPYGCSKGAADQYVLDYARSFGIPAVVFRMSCIYGRHQFGTEDQGWVAHFLLRALRHEPITIYGDGHQVRDILFADDLVEALLLAAGNARRLAGRAFNIGGGPDNVISLLELVQLVRELSGRPPVTRFAEWRAGDQRYYVSNTRSFREATGWQPRITPRQGITALHEWLRGFLRDDESGALDRRADFLTRPIAALSSHSAPQAAI